jgi:hypothetical protein
MNSHQNNQPCNSPYKTRALKGILIAGLLALAVPRAGATCGIYDNFSYKYPGYSANWTQSECENYAAGGLGGCYEYGGDAGWGGAEEGVDCSAYCSRVWAIPGYISPTTTGSHPYSTYSWYPNDGSIPTPPAHTEFVTVNSIDDIRPYDCFVLNSHFGNLGLDHMGLIESVDYNGGYIYTREANCSSQPVSGCNGPDGIHDEVWDYSTLVMNGAARIIRRIDWAAGTNTCTVGPIVMNTNGALEMFGVGSNTAVWHDWQTSSSGGWHAWASLSQSGSVPGCVVARNSNGTLEAFVVGPTKNVMRNYQTSGGGSWNGWVSLGGTGFTNLQVIRNLDGRIELFGVGTNGDLWHTWETAANGGWVGSWYDRVGEHIKPGFVVGRNLSGALELFGVGSNGHVWHNWQTNAGSSWHGWADLGGTNMNPRLAVAQDGDGRLEVYGLGNGNQDVWVNFQETPGTNYSGWYDLGGAGIQPGFVAGINSTGRLELFGVGGNTDLWHSFQITPGGGWSSWSDLGEPGLNPQLVVANNADGSLQVFGIGSNNDVMSNFQNSPGGTWFGWLDMGGNGMKYYFGQP